ncbi:hypothetical protein [Streptomyces chattanoogensis]|uniref:LigA protein n=1 Tax=Streptomyces chattanoogensis TaxID=66876 RepID=A0A0N0XS82_9ACTN|nr:hypothetical protein [Streptomyces chattanoogensis]KPC60277.1 hypothetical protein ADL29_30290 [Streptomyces chattanoogensis]
MTRTTPPRPLDVEALFPELAAYRGTTTRLHPRPGSPDASDSSVGGPLLWPADEPWPLCTEPHGRRRGRRPADIHRERQVLASAWARNPDSGPTDAERQLLAELSREHRSAELAENAPLPMLGVAQLYRRDIADLPAGPDGCDLLQVFWCPFDRHRPTGYSMSLQLIWRRSWEVTEALTAPPQPPVIGSDGYVAEPCVLHPEQVGTYPFAGLLPDDLRDRIYAWEEAEEACAEEDDDAPVPPCYQYDLSIPPGWRVGGFASWHLTDPAPMDCRTCATPMELLLTIDSSEWDGGSKSWMPQEEDREAPTFLTARPTEVTVGRAGELNIFLCPTDPRHPSRWSIQ